MDNTILGLSIVIIILLIIVLYLKVEKTYVYWFQKPECPYCMIFEPEWNKFEKAVRFSSIKPIKIDVNKDLSLAENFGVKTVPHIVRVKNNVRTVFGEQRTCSNLINFAKKKISKF